MFISSHINFKAKKIGDVVTSKFLLNLLVELELQETYNDWGFQAKKVFWMKNKLNGLC